jgi:hypothetical protein
LKLTEDEKKELYLLRLENDVFRRRLILYDDLCVKESASDQYDPEAHF